MIAETNSTTAELLAELDAQRRRIAELEAERAAWQTRDTQFRLIFDHAAIGIALVDLAGQPVQVNPALQRMLGYSAAELRRMTFAQFTHPDDIAKDWALFQETIEGRRDSYQIEKRYLRRDGSVMWGRLSVSMLRTPDGDVAYALSVVEDITARVATEHVLQRRAAQLSLLNDVGRQIASALQVDEVLNRAAQLIHRELGYHHVGIFTIDAGSGELVMRARAGGFTHLFAPDHRLPPGRRTETRLCQGS